MFEPNINVLFLYIKPVMQNFKFVIKLSVIVLNMHYDWLYDYTMAYLTNPLSHAFVFGCFYIQYWGHFLCT